MRNWDRCFFAAGLFLLIFLGGIAVGKYRYWPYDSLNRSKDAVAAAWGVYFPPEVPEFRSPRREGGVVFWDRQAASDGYTFIQLSNRDMLGAILVTMDGREVHRWQLRFGEAFAGEAPHILSLGADQRVGWHGVHLYANGDVLFNFEGSNFPFGSGLVLIDRDSRIKWKLARNTHHDLEVLPNGNIAVLAHRYVDSVQACEPFARGPYLADELLIVSAAGQELESFSLAEAFCRSPYRSMATPLGVRTPSRRSAADTSDLQHNNNIDVVTPEQAAVFPMAEAGDYLLSLHNLNMIAVVDRKTRLVKWVLAGQFMRQHDPEILPNGNILVFDNLGGDPAFGRSRILEIDPVTQEIVWQYRGGTDPLTQFDSDKGGNVEKLPNGNVLVTSAWEGRVFEVTGDADPRIVWEYVNLISADERGGIVGSVNNARRVPAADLTFLPAVPTPTS